MRAKMGLTCSPLTEAFERLWARPDLDAVFPGFLVLLHQVMRASVPLMRTAADVTRQADDPLSRALTAYFDRHCTEEADHDLWTLDDLEAAGFDRQSVLDKVPYPDVAGMAGMQYYWIHHHAPVMLLGYIAVLEGHPPEMDHIADLERRTGLPADTFRTYRFHSDVDPHHLAELDAAIDAMPLTRRDMGLIGISAAATAQTLGACIDRLDASDAPERAA
jgi:hypothetical protein